MITDIYDANSDRAMADASLRARIAAFDRLANNLANGAIAEFAPPYSDYATFPGDIIDYLKDLFARYKVRVQQLDCVPEVNAMVKAFFQKARRQLGLEPLNIPVDLHTDLATVCNMILDCLVYYYKGYPDEAYNKLSGPLTDNGCHLLNLLPQIQVSNITLFRMLRGERSNPLQLFHPPFEHREKCASYRFSIAGCPSFYCGASLQTCIEEGRYSVNDQITAIAFRFRTDAKTDGYSFIDLSLPNRSLTVWEQYSLIVFYPLIVACALKVRKPDCYFKPEYVVPQVLYQVVRAHSTDIYGISYTSTRYPKPDLKDFRQRNFAIFVRNCDQASGYNSQLAAEFSSTQPQTFVYDGKPLTVLLENLVNQSFTPLKHI